MMKHTNSGVPEAGEEFDDIQVIENTTKDNIEEEEEEEKPKPPHDFIEVQPMVTRETSAMKQGSGNIDHESYYLSKPVEKSDASMMTSTTRATKYTRPILPKVLIALLIILVMSVIALAFVLYHLDRDITHNKDRTNQMGFDMKEERQMIDELEKTIGTNKTFERLKKRMESNFNRLNKITDKNNHSLEALKVNYKHDVSALRRDNNKSYTRVSELAKEFNFEIRRLSNESRELNETLVQLDMFIEYKERYEGKIGLTFKEVVKLTKKPNRVDNEIPHLILLDYQFKEFTKKYEQRWGINYSQVIRLTDKIDFVLNQQIPLLTKIDCMYKIFVSQFEKIWNIAFKDVIRLTHKDDIAAMTLKQWLELQSTQGKSPLLKKISYMYQQFEKDYQQKWGVTFKDIISLTDGIDFDVNETIPLFKSINDWYFEGFRNYWGDGFTGYARVMTSSKGINATEILKKLEHIKKQGKVFKFLPGTFEYVNGNLSVYGYVGVYKSTLVTIFQQFFRNIEANVLCKSGGYSHGVYDGGKYNVGTMNRDHLKTWYSYIRCKGTEANINDCFKTTGDDWKHKDDAGVKCYF